MKIPAVLSMLVCAVALADPPPVATPDGSPQKRPVAITPVFSQLVAMAFPEGFVPAYENTSGKNYIQEAVPRGETVDDWSQMVTLTGARDLALNPEMSPPVFMSGMANGFKGQCPATFATKALGKLAINGHAAFVALIGCGALQSGKPHSEMALVVAIKGSTDMYSIQWAERGPPTDQPPVFDEARWRLRFRQLSPIKVCDRVPDEKPPYPSCLDLPAGK